MFWQQGTGLPLLGNVMNHLPLIRKSLCKKALLHQAELFLAARSSTRISSAQLNSRMREHAAKAKRLHDAELLLAAQPSHCSAAELNGRLSANRAKAKRLHAAQMDSLIRTA